MQKKFLPQKKKIKKKSNIDYIAYLIPLIFLIEWFLNHPSMRYGGYILIALPFIIMTSFLINNLSIKKNQIYFFTISFIIISLLIYNVRNIHRLNKEIVFYKYNIKQSPYFFVEDVKFNKVHQNEDFKIYSTLDNKMCWATKTPCSYHKKIKSKNFLWMKMVTRDDK